MIEKRRCPNCEVVLEALDTHFDGMNLVCNYCDSVVIEADTPKVTTTPTTQNNGVLGRNPYLSGNPNLYPHDTPGYLHQPPHMRLGRYRN